MLLAVLIMRGKLYVASTDLAQHYELAHSLAVNWAWPGGTPLSSGMQTYPPLAHYLGALVGLVFGSTLMGMNAVAMAAMFFCYLLLVRAVSVGRPVAVVLALAVAAIGLWQARAQHAAEGFEIYGNFFYAQLVGEAVFLAVALWLSNEERPWLVRWAVAAVLTFVGSCLYLIAAVEIAMAYLVLEAMLLLRRVSAERTFRPGWALPVLVGGVTLPLLIYFNPYFHLMVVISNHDGGLDLPGVQNLVPEFAAVLLVVGLVLGLTGPEAGPRRRQRLFLAVACCATAAAALTQETIFEVAKIGSPYAVKKYGFSTITLMVFGVAALASAWVDGRRGLRPWPLLAIGAPPLFALVATVAMPVTKPEPLKRLVAYQKSVRALLRNPRAPRDAFGATMSMNSDFSPFLNMTLTMVDLGMGQEKALEAFGMSTPKTTETYVLSKASPDDAADGCVTKVPGFPAFDFTKVKCGPLSDGQLQFSEDLSKLSFLPAHFASGWSVKEPTGVWSDGPRARLALHFDHPTGSLLMTIGGNAFLPKPGYVQHIGLAAGGARLAEWTFDGKDPSGDRQVVIPSSLIVNGDLALDFSFPDAIRPNPSGNPGEGRQLGFFVTNLSMENLRSLQPGDRIDLHRMFTLPSFLGAGWSGKEPTGVWSLGRKSTMAIPVADGDWDPEVVFEGDAFLPTPGYKQHVTVTVGSAVVADWTIDATTSRQPRSIVVPRRLASHGELPLTFEFPDATSPAAHKLSGDPRDLALFVTAVGLKASPAGQKSAAATRGPR